MSLMFLFLGGMLNLSAQDCTGFKTFTIGGWGTQCNGNNPGCYRDANFAAAFPNGLTIGCNNTLTLTSSAAVLAFLPSGSTPSALPSGALVDPAQNYSNVLAAQLVGVTLAVGFDNYDPNFASNTGSLGNLTIANGTFAGMSVNDFLAEANRAIGGCVSIYSISDLNDAATAINENFDNGTVDNGYLICNLPLECSISVVANNPCYGDNLGSLSAVVTGGVAPYSYLWSNGGTTQTIAGLVAGSYSVVVTDAVGHTSTANAVITQPDPVIASFTSTNVSCFGGNNGSATVVAVSGVVGSYTLVWGDGSTGNSISNLSAGTYTVTVNNGNGCSQNSTVTISEPSLLIASTSVTNVTCNGGNNGSATVIISGGTPSYSVLWSNGSSYNPISNLIAGTYSAVVTDANGCQVSALATVTQPMALAVAVVKTDVACYGGNGTATANVSGGTAPYTYSWNSIPVQTTATATLPVGTWSVIITDALGCTVSGNTSLVLLSCPGFVTVTQGGWGAKCSGNNWGCYRNNYFAASFPNGLVVGSCGRTLKFTSASAIQNFLPSGGTPRVLNAGTLVNPTISSYSNTLAGQAVALTLNVTFDANNSGFAPASSLLGNLIISSGPFAGWSVYQLLAEANNVLGGCSINNSISSINNALDAVNRNYDGGLVNLGYLACPCQRRNTIFDNTADGTLDAAIVNFVSYPNPFKDNATIEFTLNYNSNVSVEVYNVSGQLMGNIYAGNVSADQMYSVNFNAENYKAGIYFLRLVTDRSVYNNKIMLMNK